MKKVMKRMKKMRMKVSIELMKDLKKKKLDSKSEIAPIKQIDLNQSRELVEYLTKDNSRRARYWLLLLFGIALGSYLTWQLYQIVSPPSLIITQPQEGTAVSADLYTIRGSVELESILSMNQELILPDGEGNFYQEVNLQPGVNTFVFIAKKRFGRSTEITRHIYFQPTSTVERPTWSFIN